MSQELSAIAKLLALCGKRSWLQSERDTIAEISERYMPAITEQHQAQMIEAGWTRKGCYWEKAA